MPPKIDLIGQRFGMAVVVSPAENKGRYTAWNCFCDCGNYFIATTKDLRRGDTKSCGCFQRKQTSAARSVHNGCGTRLFHIWCGMKKRCYNTNASNYHNYGGRGIGVCDEWKNSFSAFRDWALSHGYRDDLSIDRINVNGNYEPDNCRWATAKEQASNRRNSRKEE